MHASVPHPATQNPTTLTPHVPGYAHEIWGNGNYWVQPSYTSTLPPGTTHGLPGLYKNFHLRVLAVNSTSTGDEVKTTTHIDPDVVRWEELGQKYIDHKAELVGWMISAVETKREEEGERLQAAQQAGNA